MRSESIARFYLIALVAALLLSALPALGQDDEALAQLLAEGRQRYEVLDFDGAITQLTALIDTVEQKLDAGETPSEAAEGLYRDALSLRAVAYLDLANEEAARADFRRLISFSPSYELGGNLASQFYLDMFNSIRGEMVGYVKVNVDPGESQLRIDGEPVAAGGDVPVPLLTGTHRVVVSLRGYTTEERELEIAAAETAELSVNLVRTTATVFVRTSPPGAEVLLDGEVIGVASGTAGADYSEQLTELGLRSTQVSAEFPIPYVEMGSHQLSVRMECYTSSQMLLDVSVAEDLRLKDPIVLAPSRGSLVLQGVPPEADVRLNGEERSRGSNRFDDLCSGEYRVEVRHAGGSFVADAVVSKDLVTELQVELLPALVFIGIDFNSLTDSNRRERAERRAGELFDAIKHFRIINDSDEKLSEMMAAGELTLSGFAGIAAQGGERGQVPGDLYRKVSSALRELESKLLMALVYKESRLGLQFYLYVFSDTGPYADTFIIDLDDPKQLQRTAALLDFGFSPRSSWLGIKAVDTRMREGAVVIAVQPGSPASDAGVAAGEAITAVDGSPVSGYRDVMEAIRLKEPGANLELTLEKGGESATKAITLGSSPMLLPLFSRSISYNAAMAAMSLAASMSPRTDIEQISLLNIGLALIHFNAWEDAITYLRRVDLGDRPGINQGTVEYYLGLCYESLGYRAEALEHYRAALEYESATLESNDGPLIAPRITQKVKQLEGTP